MILPLKGSLHLFYEGHGEKVLAPYEQDRFDGGWNTVSVGKATDFNLMLREEQRVRSKFIPCKHRKACACKTMIP